MNILALAVCIDLVLFQYCMY